MPHVLLQTSKKTQEFSIHLTDAKEQEFYDRLRNGGKWLYRHKLIFYDPVFDDLDFSWKYWNIFERIVCYFIGHKSEQMWRLPKLGEVGLPEKMGCVSAGICCTRCWKYID